MTPAATAARPRPPVLGVVLKGWPRISETFISNEIGLLEAQGFALRLISLREPREAFTHESVRSIRAGVDYLPSELLPGLHRLLPALAACAWRSPAGTRAAWGLLRERLAVSSRWAATLKHFLQGAWVAANVLPGSGITHLHAHFAHSPASVAMFAAAFGGLRFSISAHAKDIWTQSPKSLAHKLGRMAFAVTCTQANKDHLDGLNPGPAPIYAVRHGIDLGLFGINGRPTEAAPPYRLLTVARLTAKKGLPTVLRALALLKAQGLPFRHVLIGAGEEEAAIRALIAELGLAGAVELAGVRPHADVLKEFSRADAFVLGCRVTANGDRDGIPNVLAESMAVGVPVVSTAVSAIPELVQDGASGLLVPQDDPAAMAAAVGRILTDQALRARIIPAARRRVEEMFDNRRLILDLAAVLRRHLPQFAAASPRAP